MIREKPLEGELGETAGPPLDGISQLFYGSRRKLGVADRRSIVAAGECRRAKQVYLRTANPWRTIPESVLFTTNMGSAFTRLPNCVRLPSLADGAPGARPSLAPGGGAGGPDDAGVLPGPGRGVAPVSIQRNLILKAESAAGPLSSSGRPFAYATVEPARAHPSTAHPTGRTTHAPPSLATVAGATVYASRSTLPSWGGSSRIWGDLLP
jgi:hypothetical protein